VVKAIASALKVSASEREFEILLRRASEISKLNRLRLVKKAPPGQKSPRSAA
jgi:hypothetical protein